MGMGPGKPANECDDEELVAEFEAACRGGDHEFAPEYRNELLRRLGETVSRKAMLDELEEIVNSPFDPEKIIDLYYKVKDYPYTESEGEAKLRAERDEYKEKWKAREGWGQKWKTKCEESRRERDNLKVENERLRNETIKWSAQLEVQRGMTAECNKENERLRAALEEIKKEALKGALNISAKKVLCIADEALSTNEPTGAERAAIRPEVQWFAEQMERTLRANDHKGGWENENIYWLFGRLKEESTELLRAVDLVRDLHDDPKKIISEAADVANFAMMIADIARRINAPEGDENE